MPSPDGRVVLIDADPDLAAGVPAEDLALARRQIRPRVEVLEEGIWDPADRLDRRGGLGLLVLEGALVRDVAVRGRGSAEIVGPGDVLRPWDEAEALDASVEHSYRWQVLQRTRFADLDERVCVAMAAWPSIMSELMARAVRRVRTISLQYSVTQVQGVDVRLHLVLWHLADRWGRMTTDGVVLRLPLTHEMLGRLIGARRPSVTSALARLDREGLVRRADGGAWVLRGAPSEVVLQHESRRARLDAVA